MSYRVGIAGASGYTGAELLRLLDGHPDCDLVWFGANRAEGAVISDNAPGLHSYSDVIFESLVPDSIPELDLLFIAMPPGEAIGLVGALGDRIERIVDLGPDFRHSDPTVYEAWYGGEPRTEAELAAWIYGLPEADRSEIRGARRVANPGCYATAALLALLPLLRSGLLGSGSICVDGKSGLSGAGRTTAQHLHFPEAFSDVSAYGLGGHRHLPEISAGLARYSGKSAASASNPVVFVPHLVPVSRGLLDTCFVPLIEGVTGDDVETAYTESYAGEAFVRVVDAPPHTKAVSGSNMALVMATVDEDSGMAVAICAIDNLVKGAAGQAIQNANLMLGLDETTGLPVTGLWP